MPKTLVVTEVYYSGIDETWYVGSRGSSELMLKYAAENPAASEALLRQGGWSCIRNNIGRADGVLVDLWSGKKYLEYLATWEDDE